MKKRQLAKQFLTEAFNIINKSEKIEGLTTVWLDDDTLALPIPDDTKSLSPRQFLLPPCHAPKRQEPSSVQLCNLKELAPVFLPAA